MCTFWNWKNATYVRGVRVPQTDTSSWDLQKGERYQRDMAWISHRSQLDMTDCIPDYTEDIPTPWGQNKMADILQTMFTNPLSG